MGEVLDGVADHMANYPPERSFVVAREAPVDIERRLRDSGAESVARVPSASANNTAGTLNKDCLAWHAASYTVGKPRRHECARLANCLNDFKDTDFDGS